MTYKYIILIGVFLSSTMMYGCASIAPDTGVTGRTVNCGDGETRMIVNCRKTFKQYTRNMRVDIANIKKHAYGAGIGAEKLVKLDTVSGDLMAQQRQLCIDYNNCILTKKEYKVEAAFLRRAQAKIRQAAAQMASGPAGGGPFGGGDDGDDGGSSQPPQAPAAFNQLMSDIITGLATAPEESDGGSGSDDSYDSGSVDSYDSGSVDSYDSGSVDSYDSGSVDSYDSGSDDYYDSGSDDSYDSGSYDTEPDHHTNTEEEVYKEEE